MNLDPSEVRRLANKVDENNGEGLAELFLALLELEHSARHKKKPRLVKNYQDLIDKERRESNG